MFLKQILPLLMLGIFADGVVRAGLPSEWAQTLAGRNTIWAHAADRLFGVFMPFPTLVEVPGARVFLDLGMNQGPLLA